MVTKSGIKLLDFGLAKLREPAGVSPLSEMRTQRSAEPLTVQGTILGTLQYMAPEQLEGAEADARTDIFAFGLILYEMTAGKKAFQGKSQASLIGAILKDTPEPPSSLRPDIPPALDRVIGACLEKNPEERWQSVRDMARELNWLRQPAAVTEEYSTAAVSSGRVSRLAWTLVVVFGIATLGFLLQLYRNPSTVLPLTRLSATLPGSSCITGFRARARPRDFAGWPHAGVRQRIAPAEPPDLHAESGSNRTSTRRRHRRGGAALLLAGWEVACFLHNCG